MLNISKVNFLDRYLLSRFFLVLSVIGTVFSIFSIFIDVSSNYKKAAGLLVLILLIMIYFILWLWMNNKRSISLKIGHTTVLIKQGDIFTQEGYKVIAFNEYFDTTLVQHFLNKGVEKEAGKQYIRKRP